MRKKTLRSRAITILEVLFAVVLFAGITTSLMTLWLTHFHAIDQAQDLLAATAIANDELATAVAKGYPVTSEGPHTVTVYRSMDNVTSPYNYTWTCTVTDQNPGGNLIGVKTVNVTVTWFGNFHHARSLSMVSYVYWGG